MGRAFYPGRVRLSFDSAASLATARELSGHHESKGSECSLFRQDVTSRFRWVLTDRCVKQIETGNMLAIAAIS